MIHHSKDKTWWIAQKGDLQTLTSAAFAAKYNVNPKTVDKWRLQLVGARQLRTRNLQRHTRLWWADRVEDLKNLTSVEFATKHDVLAKTADRKRRELIGTRYDKDVSIEQKIGYAINLHERGVLDKDAAKMMGISAGYLRKLRYLGKNK